MATCQIEIPNWHPTRVNALYERGFGRATSMSFRGGRLVSRSYYRVRKAKLSDAEMIGHYAKSSPEFLPATYKRRVSLCLHFLSGSRERGGDPDSYWKSLLDGLQKCGALRNDNATWCELGSFTRERGSERKSVILLEDLPKDTPIGCLTRGCGRIARNRGLCPPCWQRVLSMIKRGVATYEQMERDGVIRPKSPKPYYPLGLYSC